MHSAKLKEIEKTVALIDALLNSSKEVQLAELSEGICSYLRKHISTGVFVDINSPLHLPNIFKRWKESSNSVIYPIKAPETLAKRQKVRPEIAAFNLFRLNKLLTDEEREEYFNSRLRLLQHIQQELITYLSRA